MATILIITQVFLYKLWTTSSLLNLKLGPGTWKMPKTGKKPKSYSEDDTNVACNWGRYRQTQTATFYIWTLQPTERKRFCQTLWRYTFRYCYYQQYILGKTDGGAKVVFFDRITEYISTAASGMPLLKLSTQTGRAYIIPPKIRFHATIFNR